MKKTPIFLMLIFFVLLNGCAMGNSTVEESKNDVLLSNNEYNPDTNSSLDYPKNTESLIVSEELSDYCIEIGDGLYRVSSIPKAEKVTLSCEYGTALRYEGATAEVYGKTLDFSVIPDEYNNDYLPYCVCDDESTVYFADYKNFYKSDFDMTTPTLLFTLSDEPNSQISNITELLSYSNTDVLFFRGFPYAANGGYQNHENFHDFEMGIV